MKYKIRKLLYAAARLAKRLSSNAIMLLINKVTQSRLRLLFVNPKKVEPALGLRGTVYIISSIVMAWNYDSLYYLGEGILIGLCFLCGVYMLVYNNEEAISTADEEGPGGKLNATTRR